MQRMDVKVSSATGDMLRGVMQSSLEREHNVHAFVRLANERDPKVSNNLFMVVTVNQ